MTLSRISYVKFTDITQMHARHVLFLTKSSLEISPLDVFFVGIAISVYLAVQCFDVYVSVYDLVHSTPIRADLRVSHPKRLCRLRRRSTDVIIPFSTLFSVSSVIE